MMGAWSYIAVEWEVLNNGHVRTQKEERRMERINKKGSVRDESKT